MAYDEQGIVICAALLNYTHYATIVYLKLAVNMGIVVPEEALLPVVV